MNNMRSQGDSIFKDVYAKVSNLSNIQSKNMDPSNILRSDTFSDNSDVPMSKGDSSNLNETPQKEEPSLYDTYAKVDEIPMASPPKNFKKVSDNARLKSLRIANGELKKVKLKEAIKEYENLRMISKNVPEERIMKSNSLTLVTAAINKAKKGN
jgi:hypothetical protein